MAQEPIVAVGLLTHRDLDRLGDGFRRCFPVSDDGQFEDLLRAIDAADAAVRRRGGHAVPADAREDTAGALAASRHATTGDQGAMK